MIVDAHTHLMVGGSGDQQAGSLANFVGSLQDLGIDKALLFTWQGLIGDPRAGNDELAEAATQFPDFLFPCCTAQPRDGDAALAELHRCVEELGMVGVKIHNWVQAIAATDPAMVTFVQEAARLDVPLVFHDGTPPYCDTTQVAYLAEQVPEATVILGHAGLGNFWPLAMEAALRFPNIYLMACGTPLMGLQQMVERVGVQRMLWGSDFPFGGLSAPASSLAKIDALHLDRDEADSILYRTAQSLFPALVSTRVA